MDGDRVHLLDDIYRVMLIWGGARYGEVSCGVARLGRARKGNASRGKAGFLIFNLAGLG